ncbi:MAG TPA: hypothetical protein VJ723_07560 [Candidatus Angelobacter sp.]|nr:hypothetical protein [Candidatus Angelobacter sp.]
MPGASIIAARAVAIACKDASDLVTVIQLDPDLITDPADLFDKTFAEVGIVDNDGIRNFRQFLDALVPKEAKNAVEQAALSPGVKVGTVADLVSAAIQAGGA